MMNTKELASLLNNRQYINEITDEESNQAKEQGLVIVFGGSDDIMYFAGAIAEELSAWEGTTAYLNHDGLIYNECNDEHCPYARKLVAQAQSIKAIWDKDGYSWIYETNIPHETFEILEGSDKYCRGIVFSLDDIKG